MLLGRMAAAQDHAAHVGAQYLRHHVLKQHLAGEVHAELGVDLLHQQAERPGEFEGRLLLLALQRHLLLQRHGQVVGQQRHRAQEVDLEAAGRAQDGLRCPVLHIDRLKADIVAPQQVHHEAENMMIGQEGKRALRLAGDDARVGLVDQLAVEHLVAHGLLIVDEDTAGGGRAAGAQGDLAGKSRHKSLVALGREQVLMQHLNHTLGQLARALDDQGRGAGLLQHIGRHLIGQRRVQQNRLVARRHQPPKSGEPAVACFHLDGDKAPLVLFPDGAAQIGREIHHHLIVFAEGQRHFLVALQPAAGHQVAVGNGNFV